MADRFILTLAWLLVAAMIILIWLLSKQDKTWDDRPGSFALFVCYPAMGMLFAVLVAVHLYLIKVVEAGATLLPS